MPYKHGWYIEGQILAAELWGDQSVEELRASNAEITQFLDSVDNRLVHIIINDEKLESLPLSFFEAQKALTYAKHPNLGWVVMIGDKDKKLKDSAQDFIITLLAKVTRARYIRLNTMDEALQHIKQVDQSISWNEVNS